VCSPILSSSLPSRRGFFPGFQQLLDNKDTPQYQAFRQCCYAQFAGESLQFLEACAQVESKLMQYSYKTAGCIPVELFFDYIRIYEHFLTSSSPWEVNVPCEIRRDVEAVMEGLKRESLKDTPVISVSTSVFDKVKRECQMMLYANVYNTNKFLFSR
jgi:hypothetical protein